MDEDIRYTNGCGAGIGYSGDFSGLARELHGGRFTATAPDVVDGAPDFSNYFGYNASVWLGYSIEASRRPISVSIASTIVAYMNTSSPSVCGRL